MRCWKRRCEAGLATLLLAGCMMVAPPAPAGNLPEPLVQAILADAQRRHPGAPVQLQQALPVTWSSAALGCPQPGQLYTDALVPGWRVLVATGGGVLAYHASRRGAWRWCPAGQEELPPPDPRAV